MQDETTTTSSTTATTTTAKAGKKQGKRGKGDKQDASKKEMTGNIKREREHVSSVLPDVQ